MGHRRSVSQLNTYTDCGERYRLERLTEGIPERPAAWTALGSAFHEAYEIYELSSRAVNLPTVFAEQYELWIDRLSEIEPDRSKWIRTPRTKSTDSDIKLRYESGVKQAAAYQEHCEISDWVVGRFPDGSLMLELKFSITFGETVVVGAVDKVEVWPDGRSVPVDIKTGAKKNAKRRQLGLYRLALSEQYDIHTVRHGQFWFTKLGASGGYVDLSRYTRDYLHDQYTKLDFAIENGIFLPNPGEACNFCPVKEFCREMGDTPK